MLKREKRALFSNMAEPITWVRGGAETQITWLGGAWLRGRGRNTAEPPRARLLTGHAPKPLWGPVRGGGVEPSSWPFTPAWLRPWDRWSSGDPVRPLAERWEIRRPDFGLDPTASQLRACSQPWPRRVGHCRAGGLGSLGVHSGPEGFRNPPPAWAEILCDLITVSQPPRASFSSLLGHVLPNPWDGEKLKRPRVSFYRPGATLGLDRWCCSGFGSSG